MENTEIKPKKRQFNPDRIVLEKETVESVSKLSLQIKEVFGGMIKLSNKEISNFLIQQRSDLLSQSELKEIKDRYFDDVRAAQWAVQKLKEAKSGGESLSLNEVLNMLQSPLIKEKRVQIKTSKKSKAQGDLPSLTEGDEPVKEHPNEL